MTRGSIAAHVCALAAVAPLAACDTLWAISRVAAVFSSTAAAMVPEIVLMVRIVSPIPLIAATECWVAA